MAHGCAVPPCSYAARSGAGNGRRSRPGELLALQLMGEVKQMENRRQLFAMMGAALTAGAGASANAAIPDEVRNGGGAESLKHPFGEQQVYFQGPTD